VQTFGLRRNLTGAFAAALLLPVWGLGAPDAQNKADNKAVSAAVISKYLQTIESQSDALRGGCMHVEISASVPKLKEQGRLNALRKISKVGRITYHVLGFHGDNTIKTQVIARYLQAEQQGLGNDKLAITPTNYKFKSKGEWRFGNREAYLFQISPRTKRVGLFKGELWLDATTYLPLYEKGRFVKNPSIFFKRVVFDRAFDIQNGMAIPEYMDSTIDARVIGKVELTIRYSNFSQNTCGDTEQAQSAGLPGLAK
jgi:hypothetical protein